MRKLAIGMVVLFALVIGADRLADFIAERAVGDTLQTSQQLAARPDVDIAGFPFLTQLIASHFDKITVTAHDVPLGDSRLSLRVSQISAVLRDVKVDFSLDKATIGRGTAFALITYGALSKTLGLDVAYAGNGQLKLGKAVTIAGQTINPSVTVSPKLVQGSLAFGAGTVPPTVQYLQSVLGVRLSLDRIPFGLTLQSVSANNSGVFVELSGSNVTLKKPG